MKKGSYYRAAREHCRRTAPALHFAATFGDAELRTALYGTWAVVHQLRSIMLDESEGSCCGGTGESGSSPRVSPERGSDPAWGRVEVCRSVLEHLYAGKETGKAELDGFAALASRHGIEQAALERYVEGLAASASIQRFATWGRLRSDFDATGGALAAHLVKAFTGVDAPEHQVIAWVAAMQLAHAMRHIDDDWKRGRLHIPLDDLVRVGLTQRDLDAGQRDPRRAALVSLLSERVASLYRGGVHFIEHLPRPAQRVAAVLGEQMVGEGGKVRTLGRSLRLLRRVGKGNGR